MNCWIRNAQRTQIILSGKIWARKKEIILASSIWATARPKVQAMQHFKSCWSGIKHFSISFYNIVIFYSYFFLLSKAYLSFCCISPNRKGSSITPGNIAVHKFSFDDEPPLAQPYLSTKPVISFPFLSLPSPLFLTFADFHRSWRRNWRWWLCWKWKWRNYVSKNDSASTSESHRADRETSCDTRECRASKGVLLL